MAFSAANYVIKAPKNMHVFLLLDTSGSMYGKKIINLESAVKDMLKSFQVLEKEVEIKVTVISFSTEAKVLLKTVNSSVALESMPSFLANGQTAMGQACRLVKELIEDRSVVSGKDYCPLVVLVSDGVPTDVVEPYIKALSTEGRSQKAKRLALAIGQDADLDLLQSFIGNDQADDGLPHLFYAQDAKDINKFFKFVTMSVTSTTKSKQLPASASKVNPVAAANSPSALLSGFGVSTQSKIVDTIYRDVSSGADESEAADPFHGDKPPVKNGGAALALAANSNSLIAGASCSASEPDSTSALASDSDPYHGDLPVSRNANQRQSAVQREVDNISMSNPFANAQGSTKPGKCKYKVQNLSDDDDWSFF